MNEGMAKYYEMLRKNEDFFRNAKRIAAEIKERAEKILGDCEVFIVGSYARGEHTLSSDLDILIVSDRIPERFSFEWYVEFVRTLTDDDRINIHPVCRKKFRDVEKAYTPRIRV
ncbi:Nucleotidyltransferase domain [Geoglobus ahangari]|uniref:Nucleotidyltransferase domain n=1 Tax=Geoglobus ahangari TaxID=113653 RepID=A0A0F7IGB8_9EURY|nr:nucleotidyltransferase domain-containing protein [Geoglobus ahangari]AKG91674.1 Nucleotidyltransferase domain [Geoglobus ahangari]